MRQILWGTDLHYNFLADNTLKEFHEMVANALRDEKNTTTECVIVSGDISEGDKIVEHLKELRAGIGLPVYFVCGNHDYWHSSFEKVRRDISALADLGITWLGNKEVSFVTLSKTHALVGADGWYDAALGDWHESRFIMNDWHRIEDFSVLSMDARISRFRELALESALHIDNGIKKAVEAGVKDITILTHVPPFSDVAVYRGRPTEDHALPWYTSGIMGDHILQQATENPDITFTVLCGHTHEPMSKRLWNNLTVHVGGAHYGRPRFQAIALPDVES